MNYGGSEWAVGSVGAYAFYDCGSLKEVSLLSAESAGVQAFDSIGSLAYIRFSNSLQSVGRDAFPVSFYSGDMELSADAASLAGRIFTGSGDGILYESFEISWLDGAGVLADTTFVMKGRMPMHEGLEKEPTDTFSYEFAGWVPDVAAAYFDAFYTAEFREIPKEFTVTVTKNVARYGSVSGKSFTARTGPKCRPTATC